MITEREEALNSKRCPNGMTGRKLEKYNMIYVIYEGKLIFSTNAWVGYATERAVDFINDNGYIVIGHDINPDGDYIIEVDRRREI